MLNQTVSIREVQRQYKDVVSTVQQASQPVIVMNRSQAQLAMINLQQLEEYERLKLFSMLDKARTNNQSVRLQEGLSDITAEVEVVRESRWVQRFSNYSKAFIQLFQFIERESLNDLEQQGLIQVFEHTFKLAWSTLKGYLEMQGETEMFSIRDVIRMAFKRGLIEDGEIWMDMIKSKTLCIESYQEAVADKIVMDIRDLYFSAFQQLEDKFQKSLSATSLTDLDEEIYSI